MPSWPGTNGGMGLIGQSPRAAWMSVWHRPEVSILTRIWSLPGVGSGISFTVSAEVKSVTTAAFMVLSPSGIGVRAADWQRAGTGVDVDRRGPDRGWVAR